MPKTHSSQPKARGANLTATVTEAIRKTYLSRNSETAAFLPSERELAVENNVARTTVRWALQQLASEGLLRAEHGRGYRTLPRATGPKVGSRLAIVTPVRKWSAGEGGISTELETAIQQRALDLGYQALFVRMDQASHKGLATTLLESSVFSAILTQDDPETFNALKNVGIPCAVLECAFGTLPADYFNQDNFNGARLAAAFLLERDRRRITWFGPVRDSRTSLERFAGASTTFTQHEKELPRDRIIIPGADLEKDAMELLSRKDRPDGVLALWADHAIAIGRAAERLGLQFGTDFDLVGWATERVYENQFVPIFERSGVPATVVWSTAEIAEICMMRLLWHLREPDLKPLQMIVPTRLIMPKAGNALRGPSVADAKPA